jgi:tyrosinase
MVRIRRDVWKLPSTDDTLTWYARSVAKIQSRLITDPTSWRYQAAIHDYRPTDDPLARPGETLPSQAEQLKFWFRCQHGSWFFLPWHRGYLFYFEQILLQVIQQLKDHPLGLCLIGTTVTRPTRMRAVSHCIL